MRNYLDDPEVGEDQVRTTGGYLRVDGEDADGDDVRALCAAIRGRVT